MQIPEDVQFATPSCFGGFAQPTMQCTYLFPEVLQVPAGDDGDVDVGHVGEALEALLALGADEGELGGLGQAGEGPVKVEDDAQLGAHLDVGAELQLEAVVPEAGGRVAALREGKLPGGQFN